MSTVSTVTSAASTASTKETAIGKDAFLKMLIAQLKNQNPLNPMDGTDFAAQLAQFSSLEQLTNMSTQMEKLSSSIGSMVNGQLVDMIGNYVTAKGNSVIADGTAKTLSYTLPSDIKNGQVDISDASGNTVASQKIGSAKAGLNTVVWNTSGRTGNYTFAVTGQDAKGNPVSGTTMTSGTVTGVNFESGSSSLVVNGQNIAFGDIVSISKQK
jgi:flagellar basal-body rod modification protein FlgD